MSSVTRFIRQIPVSTTYYNASVVVGTPATYAFEFINDPSNYVGNYPPGYMSAASSALVAAINQNVAGAGGAAAVVLRDMGKTIYAAYTTSQTPATDPRNTPSTVTYGYFRQVQLLAPKPIGLTSNTLIGGVAGTTFGVLGAPNNTDVYTDYLTFFIPVSVAGIFGPAVATGAYAIAGGQM
jgi:hypothetical protein